mmetsp:Transcript_93441/g.273585  ORF Transcript_93441/g.273585 Transcript_93441/m.273585 type:complete len:780 (+) Transcript_93441:35-2374(+)
MDRGDSWDWADDDPLWSRHHLEPAISSESSTSEASWTAHTALLERESGRGRRRTSSVSWARHLTFLLAAVVLLSCWHLSRQAGYRPDRLAAVDSDTVIQKSDPCLGSQDAPCRSMSGQTGGLQDKMCHTAVDGEPCYQAVVWAKATGIKLHPEWYGDLTSSSSFGAFQAHLHEVNQGGGMCSSPCREAPATVQGREMEEEPCFTAVEGDPCYNAVDWAMSFGIMLHPDWYEGLTSASSFEDFQAHLHRTHEGGGVCQVPCQASTITVTATTSTWTHTTQTRRVTTTVTTTTTAESRVESGHKQHTPWQWLHFPSMHLGRGERKALETETTTTTTTTTWTFVYRTWTRTTPKTATSTSTTMATRTSTSTWTRTTPTTTTTRTALETETATTTATTTWTFMYRTWTSTTPKMAGDGDPDAEEQAGAPWKWLHFPSMNLGKGRGKAGETQTSSTTTTTTWTFIYSRVGASTRASNNRPSGTKAIRASSSTTSMTTTTTSRTTTTTTVTSTTTTVGTRKSWPRKVSKSEKQVLQLLAREKEESSSRYGVHLFCFAVMVPWGNERDLLREAHTMNAGIFGCEDAAIYSSEAVEVAPGVKTIIARDSLKCDYGGEFKTALNNDIFMDIWKKVVGDGAYARSDWTVKVDPDSVFFAHRLRQRLQSLQAQADKEPMYINNCKLGMHGPFEVLSRKAVKSWYDGMDHCVAYFRKLCSGDCLWGEDMFLDQCFQRVLHVKRVNIYNVLLEDHCFPPKGWDSCHNRESVAFHPFKSPGNFTACLERAVLH